MRDYLLLSVSHCPTMATPSVEAPALQQLRADPVTRQQRRKQRKHAERPETQHKHTEGRIERKREREREREKET